MFLFIKPNNMNHEHQNTNSQVEITLCQQKKKNLELQPHGQQQQTNGFAKNDKENTYIIEVDMCKT